MNRENLEELIACLPDERTLFHYFPGQYAFQLLALAVQHFPSVSQMKKTAFSRLLNQKKVNALLASHGSGALSPELFTQVWHESSQAFVLTVDRWGHRQWDDQMTRNQCNLVLQLNFSEQHNRAFHRLVKPQDDYIFNYEDHPAMNREKRSFYRDTLAWARMDIDLDSGEVLIEEIQSDWVRCVRSCCLSIKKGGNPWHLSWCDGSKENFITYAEKVMAPFYKIWSEAMMAAALRFIQFELGISKVYYHTFESGRKLKQVSGGSPPQSLYRDLPRKFCFQQTNEDPEFLKNDRTFKRKKRALREVQWYQLAL